MSTIIPNILKKKLDEGFFTRLLGLLGTGFTWQAGGLGI
jgi:hypothetical protein